MNGSTTLDKCNFQCESNLHNKWYCQTALRNDKMERQPVVGGVYQTIVRHFTDILKEIMLTIRKTKGMWSIKIQEFNCYSKNAEDWILSYKKKLL